MDNFFSNLPIHQLTYLSLSIKKKAELEKLILKKEEEESRNFLTWTYRLTFTKTTITLPFFTLFFLCSFFFVQH